MILFTILLSCNNYSKIQSKKNKENKYAMATQLKAFVKFNDTTLANGVLYPLVNTFYYAYPNYIATNGDFIIIRDGVHLKDSTFNIYSMAKQQIPFYSSDINGSIIEPSASKVKFNSYIWNALKETVDFSIDTVKTFTTAANRSRIYIGKCIPKDTKSGHNATYSVTLSNIKGNGNFYILPELEQKSGMRVTKFVIKDSLVELIAHINYFTPSVDTTVRLNALIEKVQKIDTIP